jgi:hypothetical protein
VAVTLLVEYGAVRNRNARKGGWLPQVWVNGRERRDVWATRSHDLDDAREMAEALARDEASRYVGDWRITVRERKAVRWP